MVKNYRKYILGSISIIILFLIWEIVSLSIANQYILPSPLFVGKTLIDILIDYQTYQIISITFLRLIVAFILSSLIAVILGIIAGNYKFIDELMHPFIVILRTLPVASIIVIILILFGNEYSLFLITFLMIFPIVYEGTKQGVLNIPTELKNTIAMETNNKSEIMFKLHFPLSLPYIKTSLLQSFGLGFKVIVMAEFISQTTKGIGNELFKGSISIQYEKVFAWTIILIILVFLVEIIVKILNNRISNKPKIN
ncbi:MAG: ABC transporter permease subunit [Candidatus Izemoplasmatales bacterium]